MNRFKKWRDVLHHLTERLHELPHSMGGDHEAEQENDAGGCQPYSLHIETSVLELNTYSRVKDKRTYVPNQRKPISPYGHELRRRDVVSASSLAIPRVEPELTFHCGRSAFHRGHCRCTATQEPAPSSSAPGPAPSGRS